MKYLLSILLTISFYSCSNDDEKFLKEVDILLNTSNNNLDNSLNRLVRDFERKLYVPEFKEKAEYFYNLLH